MCGFKDLFWRTSIFVCVCVGERVCMKCSLQEEVSAGDLALPQIAVSLISRREREEGRQAERAMGESAEFRRLGGAVPLRTAKHINGSVEKNKKSTEM